MKKLVLFTFLLTTFISQAQDKDLYIETQLEMFRNSKDKLVSVGLSPSEVKSKIGNPKAVESGFPDSREMLISEMPGMAGQINYSTWFYVFEPKDLILPKSTYIVNGEPTSERIYLSYIGKSLVYYVEGKLISEDLAKDYKLTGSSKLKSKPLDKELTKDVGEGTITMKVIPIYAVIFDKGTQVAASTRAYFLK